MTVAGRNNCCEYGFVFCEVGNGCLYTERVLFIVTPRAAALSYRKPASAGTPRESCGARDTVKGKIYTGVLISP